MQLGPVRFAVDPKSHAAHRLFEHKLIIRETAFCTDSTADQAGIQGIYAALATDDARLDTLFLAVPVSWKGTLVQHTGRLHRLHPGKKEVQIYDYVDREVPMLLRMFEKRLRTYRAIGYARGEAPLGLAEPSAESSGENDRVDSCHIEEEV